MQIKDYPPSRIRSQIRSSLLVVVLLLATVDVSNAQVSIKERVGIRASRSNKLDVDSTGKYMPGEEAISPRINKSMQTTGAMITVPESSYVTIAVVSADAASTIDLILRSPLNETIIPDASGNVGAKWESPFFPTEAVLDVGIFWVWRNYSGYEYGVEMTQVAEHAYILYFEDLGDLYGPYIDYDDLVVDVRIHGKPDHLNVTVDPDSIFYSGYTDITAVAIDNEGNEMSLGDNAMMTLSAEPASIGSFYPSNEVLYGDLRNGYVSYLADQEQPTCMQDVVVTVSGEGASGTANVVVKESPCMVMSTSSDKIHPGESVDITMQQLDCSGNLMPYPADQYFYIWMNSDPKYGKLRDQSGNEDWFVEGVQPFTFIAADSTDVDTTVVEIEAWAWSGGGGASRIAGVGVKDTRGNPPIASTTLNEIMMKHAKLEEKLKKRLAEVKAAAPVPSGPVPSSVKYANAQANTKNKLTITSEGVTDCRSVVHITITREEPELIIVETPRGVLGTTRESPPRMPQDKVLKVQLKNFDRGAVKYTWDFTVKYNRPDVIDEEKNPKGYTEGKYEGSGAGNNSEVTTLPLEWKPSIIRGGDLITLHVKAEGEGCVKEKTIEKPFKIFGLNPSKSDVKAKLSLQEQVIAYCESRFRQFLADLEIPRFGGPHGFGIMQVDPPTDDEQMWSWTANIVEGQNRFAQKIDDANGYADRFREGKTRWSDIPYKNVQPLSDDEQQMERFQRYNGGAFYRWDPDNPRDPNTSGSWIRVHPLGEVDKNGNPKPAYGDVLHAIYSVVLKVQNGQLPASYLPPDWN